MRVQSSISCVPGAPYLADGIHPAEGKKHAIEDAPKPQNAGQLRLFVGLLNYYGLPNMANILAPLYRLLQMGAPWCWEAERDVAFKHSKQLSSSSLLIHFNPEKVLILLCDASSYGLGAMLSHQLKDGSERPIAYTSCTLASAEAKYYHVEKEGLVIIFGVNQCHQYLVGRRIMIYSYSDHKPLRYPISETCPVPPMASSRIHGGH